jgi:predicted negative regulator of RcsB-dependent stress response
VEIYDSEEAQVEALKAWWKENQRSVIIGAILGIAIVSGWTYWQDYKHAQADQASGLYQQLLSFANSGKNDSAEKVSEQITKQYSSTAYANYAPLMQAKLKVANGDLAGAKAILEAQLKKSDVVLQNVARIELVRLMLATGEYEKGLQIISEADLAKTKSFNSSYEELTGDLYVALDRLGEARTSYKNALNEGSSSPLLQMKLDDITAPETVQNPTS